MYIRVSDMYIQMSIQYVYVTGLINDKYLSFGCHLSSLDCLYILIVSILFCIYLKLLIYIFVDDNSIPVCHHILLSKTAESQDS